MCPLTSTGCVRPSIERMAGVRCTGMPGPRWFSLMMALSRAGSKNSLSDSACNVAEETTSRRSGRLRCTCSDIKPRNSQRCECAREMPPAHKRLSKGCTNQKEGATCQNCTQETEQRLYKPRKGQPVRKASLSSCLHQRHDLMHQWH
jgi:hypothetical protein